MIKHKDTLQQMCASSIHANSKSSPKKIILIGTNAAETTETTKNNVPPLSSTRKLSYSILSEMEVKPSVQSYRNSEKLL
jgi:hypothetical protein